MSDTPDFQQETCNILRTCLSPLPPQDAERLLARLQQTLHYEPVIVFGFKSFRTGRD